MMNEYVELLTQFRVRNFLGINSAYLDKIGKTGVFISHQNDHIYLVFNGDDNVYAFLPEELEEVVE